MLKPTGLPPDKNQGSTEKPVGCNIKTPYNTIIAHIIYNCNS